MMGKETAAQNPRAFSGLEAAAGQDAQRMEAVQDRGPFCDREKFGGGRDAPRAGGLPELIDLLEAEQSLSRKEFVRLIRGRMDLAGDQETARRMDEYLFAKADQARRRYYGNKIYIRGLIEFTNYCKNDCYYCGIRKSSRGAQRYRLTEEQIMGCCAAGYELGFRTFVLQGGEDPWFTDERMIKIISAIRRAYPDCAVTLSIGEKSRESYQALFDAGADRYLLRHETADSGHYALLHPPEMRLESRLRCLWELREIGYQVGCGFMVGSPGQTAECLARDMLLMKDLQPHMVGIGPFVPHSGTPFSGKPGGTAELTFFLLGVCRLLLPRTLLPSTTALATIHPQGRERGILAGANVVMPNLSPGDVRSKYLLYDNKAFLGCEAAESLEILKGRLNSIGFEAVVDRGDSRALNG